MSERVEATWVAYGGAATCDVRRTCFSGTSATWQFKGEEINYREYACDGCKVLHERDYPAAVAGDRMRKAISDYTREQIAWDREDRKQEAAVPTQQVDVVFDGPPGPKPGRFVEVENMDGASVGVGEWIDRVDGYWVLRLTVLKSDIKGTA